MKQEVFELDQYYHIYNRGNNFEDIFIEERNYNYFLQLVAKYLLPITEIYAYCLLKNHFHLVLKIKSKEEVDVKFHNKIHLPFSNLFNAYTKSINKAYGRSGSLFQEHLKRIKIGDEDYLKQLIVYTHLNPVKHKFVDDFKSYKHSSYRSYFSESVTNLHRELIVNLFEGLENFEYCHYDRQDQILNSMELDDE
ncbi:transposase [Flavobacterium davisii]|uniref:Transposase n=1 Tax=Flavobacterium davisii TaxID=2906077 RepID=A0A246GIM8_9FLAO|nr:transposase [Flavobacterium davisii]OWP84089.1 transposase [Flavobacterium davisii]